MKPNNANVATVEGDLQGLDIQMGIDPNSFAHIMSVLTDLYSDPALAVIREYSTNARDAMIEAGRGHLPIEVSLPNNMTPYFKVRDEGVGLNVSDIENIYSKYGASTKRDSDDVVGMLGLGCKSALTYTSQFTVTSVKNGTKVTVSISRTEAFGGVMQIVDTRATDDDNWTEVSIPAKAMYDFKEKAERFFKFWEPGTVLVNGQQPAHHTGEQVTPNVWLQARGSNEGNLLVMGNVAYPIKGEFLTGLPNNSSIIIYANMGEVNFTPSREQLHYTALTKATIKKYNDEFRVALDAKVRGDIESAPSHYEAIMTWKKWKVILSSIQRRDYSYKGQTLPDNMDFYINPAKPEMGRIPSGHYLGSLDKGLLYLDSFFGDYDYAGNVRQPPLVVLNYPNVEKCTAPQKEKLAVYASEQKLTTRGFLLLSGKTLPGSPWTDGLRTADWEKDIKPIKLVTAGPYRTLDGKYEVWDRTQRNYRKEMVGGWTERHLDPKETVIYWSPAEFDGYKINAQVLTELAPDATLVSTGKNRWEKMKRLYPKNTHVYDAVKNRVEEISKNASAEAKIYAVTDDHNREVYQRFDETQIDDPEIANFIRALKKGQPEFETMEKQRRLVNKVLGYAGSVAFKFPMVRNPFNSYPLVNVARLRDSIEYMNLVYAKRIKGE